MEITKLPTDNLYKFLALSGMVIAILSVLLPFTLIRDAVLEQINIYGAQEIDTVRLDDIENKIK